METMRGQPLTNRREAPRIQSKTANPTKKQHRLVEELDALTTRMALNYKDIAKNSDPELRTTALESVKDQLIRSAVILDCVLADEFVSSLVAWYFFGRKRSFQKQWRTKRFRNFNHYILERLSLTHKLDLVTVAYKLPSPIVSELRALNELRNSLAHSFFPQNRRKAPEWKGQSIYALDAFMRFADDM